MGAAICLLIPIPVYAGFDHWIWPIPHEHRFAVFMFGFWLTHISAALGALLSLNGRGIPRIVYIAFSLCELYTLDRLFVIA